MALHSYFTDRLGHETREYESLPDLETVLGFMETELALDSSLLVARDFSVVTFNWDVLLDDALGRGHLVTTEGPPTYGQASKQYEAFFRWLSGVGAGSIENLSPRRGRVFIRRPDVS